MKINLLIHIRRSTICFIIILQSFTNTNGQEKQIFQAASLLATDSDLRCKISAMTGVGCDTVKMKQILQLLAESKNTATEKRLTAIKADISLLTESVKTAGSVAKSSSSSEWTYTDNIPTSFQWYVSPDGSDTNAGTQQAPFRTIYKAISRASAGDAIKLENGKYNENVYISKNVYLVGNLECPQSVIIDACAFENAVYIYNSSPELHGMKMINGENGFPLIFISNGYPRLSHLILTENPGMAIETYGSFFCTLYNSLIYGNNAGSGGALIKLNPSVNYGGIDMCNVTIADNQGSYAVNLTGSLAKELLITNSILYNPQMTAEINYYYLQSYIDVQYSNIRNKDYLGSGVNYHNGVIDEFPYFDETDPIQTYHFWDYSPCIDAGRPDFYDRTRPPGKGGSRSDLGFYGWESRATGVCISAAPGDDPDSAIDIGTYYRDFDFDDSRQSGLYTNYYNWIDGVDIFYRFTTTTSMDIIVNLCGSTALDTYAAILTLSGSIIAQNDDHPAGIECTATGHSYLYRENLAPGTYYVMAKVKPGSTGTVYTYIEGFLRGENMNLPINAGEYSYAFQYSNPQNTGNFANTYTGQSTNDVFYKFKLNQKMDITVSHCGSGLDNTYIHLLDTNGDVIAYNDDYAGEGMCSSPLHACIKRTLDAGTYYVVSEGNSQNGNIKTSIQGLATTYTEDLGYPGNPPVTGNNTGDNSAVGITAGAFNVSATGAATYSIPIAVPPGINGLQPSLAIVYNSQSGNGVAGWGGSLAGTSAITRVPKSKYYDQTAEGLTYLADVGYALDGQRLVLSSGTAGQNGAIYHTEADPFTKITLHGSAANAWFEVVTKDGMKYYYGGVGNSDGRHVYYDTSNPSNTVTKVYGWHLDYVEDPAGNYMNYYYTRYEHFTYLASVIYGKNKHVSSSFYNMVSMSYQSRTDQAPFIFDGIPGKMLHRLDKVTCRTGNDTFREYMLEYANTDHFSRLVSVTEKNGEGEALKPLVLDWGYYGTSNSHTAGSLTLEGSVTGFEQQYYSTADLNGDGVSDIISLTPGYSAPDEGGAVYTLSQHFLSTRQDNGSFKFVASGKKYLAPSMEIEKINHNQRLGGPMAFNALGDGRQYLLTPLYLHDGFGKRTIFYIYNHENNNTHNRVPSPTGIQGLGHMLITASSELPVYVTGDIDNDGIDEIVAVETGSIGGSYPGKIGKVTGIASDQVVSFGNWIDLSLDLPQPPKKMFIADFNGDGMNELLVFHSEGYTMYFNQTTGGARFHDSKKIARANISDCSMIRTGDFNGDGLPDFILNAQNDDQWYFALNNGNGTFTKRPAGTIDLY
ncbi:MAG: FG-GAP-like repeat-containing protein, partial [Bacteroidales bacterium]|nr:FG-GAP-like repeat-containing protein [Bacteroidales bacterium]